MVEPSPLMAGCFPALLKSQLRIAALEFLLKINPEYLRSSINSVALTCTPAARQNLRAVVRGWGFRSRAVFWRRMEAPFGSNRKVMMNFGTQAPLSTF